VYSKKNPWVHHSKYGEESLRYINARRKGITTSLVTPWKKINKSSINGFERNTITVFAGRPANGKTILADQLVREVFKLNPKLKLKVLQCQFEMLGRSTKIRELSAVTKKSYRELCSADEPLSDELYKKCIEHIKQNENHDVDILDTPQTVENLKKIICQYMEHNSYMGKSKNKDGEIVPDKKYRNTLVTLDHSLLVLCKKGQTDKKDMLYELGEALTELKKIFPIWFVILSQLNRDITKPERNKSSQAANYVIESDLFGADALMQHADNIYAMTIPYKRFIQYYGPDEFIIENDELIAVHIIKSRSGITGLTFLKADFETMSINDIERPPVKPKRKTPEVQIEQK
jgi:replicative DNA helicase